MKRKITYIAILAVVVGLIAGLQPFYGIPSSIKTTFLIGCAALFIWGCTRFVLKKQGGLLAWGTDLCRKVKSFIKTQARDYGSIAWYKKPIYWLTAILVVFHILFNICYTDLSAAEILFQSLYFIPLIFLMFAGLTFPFVILLFIYGLHLSAIMNTVLDGFIPFALPVVSAIWFDLSVVALIVICLIINQKRRKTHSGRKHIYKEICILALYAVYCTGVFYAQSEHNLKIRIEACIKQNDGPDINKENLKTFCTDIMTNR